MIELISGTPVQKTFFSGTHRSRDPSETWDRITPLFAKFGITRVSDVTGLDCIGIPVCNAIRPNARSLSASQGKGVELANARVSAAMEAIELYHAERPPQEALSDSFARLGPENAVNPLELSVLTDRIDVADQRPISWVVGKNLISGQNVLVPRDAVACDLRIDAPSDGLILTSSNGLGSGNHIIEAMLHATCEIIERDATCLHQAASRFYHTEPALIDPDTVDDPTCRYLMDKLKAAHNTTFIWHQFSDLGVPSFGCAISDTYGGKIPGAPIGTFQGYGCHPDRGIALSRAITEAVQSRLTYISGARDDIYRDDYAAIQSDRNRAAWLRWLDHGQRRGDFRDIPSIANDTVSSDFDAILSILERAGFDQVIAVNLTFEDVGIPVVKMLVPGLVEPTIDNDAPANARIHTFLKEHAASAQLLRSGLRTEKWA